MFRRSGLYRLTHSMKSCTYCGRENNDDALHCRECCTQFHASSVGDLGRVPFMVAGCGFLFMGSVVGFLSLLDLTHSWMAALLANLAVVVGGVLLAKYFREPTARSQDQMHRIPGRVTF